MKKSLARRRFVAGPQYADGWTSSRVFAYLDGWLQRWSFFVHPQLCDIRALAKTRESFVARVLAKKIEHYHFGFRVKAADPGQAATIKAWAWDDRDRRLQLEELGLDVWTEWLIAGNVPAVWMPGRDVTVMDCENVTYSNRFGIEKLKFPISVADRRELGLPETGEVIQDPAKRKSANKIQFRVLCSEKKGNGFGPSPWEPMLRDLAIYDLLRIGDFTGAWARKQLVRHTKKGHKIDGGPKAGMATHFLSKEWGKVVREKLESSEGLLDLITNFDAEILYAALESDYFDLKFYRAVQDRLTTACGPAALIVEPEATERKANLNILDAFYAEAVAHRRRIGFFLEDVINRALRPPVPVRVAWGSAIFKSRKQLLAELQGAVGAGLMSPQTAREELGLDDEEESARLRQARENKDDYTPVFEAKQGLLAPEPGRQPGSRDHE